MTFSAFSCYILNYGSYFGVLMAYGGLQDVRTFLLCSTIHHFFYYNLQKGVINSIISCTVFEGARTWICNNPSSNTGLATVHCSCVRTIPCCKCKLDTWRTRRLSTWSKTKCQL